MTRPQRTAAMAEALEHTEDVPPDIVESLRQYVVDGRPTGEFLRAVLRNDLTDAVTRADKGNLALLPEIVRFCWNQLPGPCWGDRQKVDQWLHDLRFERAREEIAANADH